MSGSRSGRRRRSRLRHRIGLLVLGLVALGGGLTAGLVLDRSGEPGPEPSPSRSEPPVAFPQNVHLLEISSTFDEQIVLSTAPLLIAAPAAGEGPVRILIADPALRVVGPARDAPLREHAAGFGPEGLSGALRNELGLRIDEVATLTEAQLAGFLDEFGEIAVTLDRAIAEDGETIYAAGTHAMSATELVTFLAFPFDDSSIDATGREALLASVWRSIASLPGLASRAASSTLPVPAAEALTLIAGASAIEGLAVADTSKGPVLDEIGYRVQAALLEGAWLHDADPAERLRVELRGRSIVAEMLLLIADGIRIDAVRSARQSTTTVETGDPELGRRIVDLIGGEIVVPDEPLLGGLDARITLGSAA